MATFSHHEDTFLSAKLTQTPITWVYSLQACFLKSVPSCKGIFPAFSMQNIHCWRSCSHSYQAHKPVWDMHVTEFLCDENLCLNFVAVPSSYALYDPGCIYSLQTSFYGCTRCTLHPTPPYTHTHTRARARAHLPSSFFFASSCFVM